MRAQHARPAPILRLDEVEPMVPFIPTIPGRHAGGMAPPLVRGRPRGARASPCAIPWIAGHGPAARREHYHGGAPVRKAVAPQQVGRPQMPQLDELRHLRARRSAELLTVTGKIPLRL